MFNVSNLIRFVIGITLIAISFLALVIMVLLEAITQDFIANHFVLMSFVILLPLIAGGVLLMQSRKKWKEDSQASLELQLINLARTQNGVLTVAGTSTKLNKPVEKIQEIFRGLEGKDLFEVQVNDDNGVLQYRLLE